MIESLLLSMLIIAIAIALLSVKVIVKKNGQFESQHIHDSKAMKERNIHCVLSQDKEARQENRAY
jgi:DNA/RNA endonuclease YhcR with UshA esterase domain